MPIPREHSHYRIDHDTGCWLWVRSLFSSGYAQCGHNGKNWRAHRLMWTLTNGAIPDGKIIMHTCDTPRCVNPQHLRIGTLLDNNRDMVAKGRARHPRGSEHGNAKIDEGDVRSIRERCAAGENQHTIADDYGISNKTVSKISRRERWAHIP